MSMIDFNNTEMAVAVIFTLIIMFVISFAVSFLFFILADLSPKYEKGIILDANHNFYAYLGDHAVYIFGLFID